MKYCNGEWVNEVWGNDGGLQWGTEWKCWIQFLYFCFIKGQLTYNLICFSFPNNGTQTPQLPKLLEEAEGWGWWSINGESFQRVVNWWVMSCDPRIVLALPDPSPVDLAVIR